MPSAAPLWPSSSLLGIHSLSFYKEELAGETKNYVHLSAAAQKCSVEDVLRQLVGEVMDSARCMEVLTANDPELARLWTQYFQVRTS